MSMLWSITLGVWAVLLFIRVLPWIVGRVATLWFRLKRSAPEEDVEEPCCYGWVTSGKQFHEHDCQFGPL